MPDDDDFVVPVDYVHAPPLRGPEIRAALAEENRAVFDVKWAEAIDHAARTYDLGPAQELLVQYRGVAAVDGAPELVADVERTKRRIAEGKESFVYLRAPGDPWPKIATERDRVIDWPDFEEG